MSGALAEEANTVNNVALVYSEPPEAAHPTLRWRLYTFKGGKLLSLCKVDKVAGAHKSPNLEMYLY